MRISSRFRVAALAAALCLFSAATLAATDPAQLTIRDILTQQTQLRAQVVAGKGAFKDVAQPEREALIERQDRVLKLLTGIESVEELPPDQRVVVFNDLEFIKAAVTKAEDDRMICEHTKTVGSNRTRSVCMTVREHREIRDRTREGLRRGAKCNESALTCTGEGKPAGLSGGL